MLHGWQGGCGQGVGGGQGQTEGRGSEEYVIWCTAGKETAGTRRAYTQSATGIGTETQGQRPEGHACLGPAKQRQLHQSR